MRRPRWAMLVGAGIAGVGFAAGVTLTAAAVDSPGSSHRAAPVPTTHQHTSAVVASATGPTDLNGHHITGVKAADVAAEHEPDVPLDPATRAQVAQELVVARDAAAQYPTVADAEAAGYHLVAGFGPGAGAHYVGGPMTGAGPFDPTKAQSLLYDGISPTSEIVGLMYFGMGEQAPEGFAGPNDHWHRHSSVCTKFANGIIDVPFPPDADVTAEQCASVDGMFMQITGWMVHAWVVPGWESPGGVFSHENANLRCADGTFDTDEIGKCQGS